MTSPLSADEVLRLGELARKATPGKRRAMREGNQYVGTSYMPTAKLVGASRVEGQCAAIEAAFQENTAVFEREFARREAAEARLASKEAELAITDAAHKSACIRERALQSARDHANAGRAEWFEKCKAAEARVTELEREVASLRSHIHHHGGA